jgi:DNA adenine methylase
MLLRRLGSKKRLLPQLLELFPEKIVTFIDLFMGSGVVSLAMEKRCQYIFANDRDHDIFNLFDIMIHRKEELLEAVQMMPCHEALFQHWRTHEENDLIWQAVRFLMLSNFGSFGLDGCMQMYMSNSKAFLLEEIRKTYFQSHIKFLCCDFREVLPKIHFMSKRRQAYKYAFIYADPPYLETENNYKQEFTEQDTTDLFQVCLDSGFNFAISEFRHPFVIKLAEINGLYITSLGERRNIGNRAEEILITNYEPIRKQMTIDEIIV